MGRFQETSFSLSCAYDFSETSTEMVVENCKCYCKKQMDNNLLWSIFLSTIEMTS